jgi:surface carbohydrate biosynthesis protein
MGASHADLSITSQPMPPVESRRTRPRRIGFIVDHPKRDLPGGAMLAHVLARRGVETLLVPLYEQAVDVPLLGLDALVINYARPANIELVRGYVDAGLPVWVLDTEGGVLADDGANTPDRLAAYVRDSGWGGLLAGYFFWGQTLHDAFVAHSGMAPGQLHVSGCPRFDWAAAQWRDLLRHSRSGYTLVNANFPLVNPLFVRSPEAELDALVSAGWQRDYVVQMIADSRLILNNYIDTVARVAGRLPERRFLVRPHPFESADRYRQAFAALPNVEVDGAGSVLNVIRNADCVLHLNCGTSIEAVMLDKLPLSMEFLNTPLMSRHSSLPSRISQPVASEEALVTLLGDLRSAEAAFGFASRYQSLIEPWFHHNDGRAAERVADVLLQAVAGRAPRPPSLAGSLASSRRAPRWGQRLQAALGNLVGSNLSARVRALAQPARRSKQLQVEEIASLVGALDRQGGGGSRVSRARHPFSGAPLASVRVQPTGVL